MKNVIVLQNERVPLSPAIFETLREGGITTITHTTSGRSRLGQEASNANLPPLALIVEIHAGADVSTIREMINRINAVWPDVPRIAVRRKAQTPEERDARTPDDSSLKHLGFHAVADEPAQLPALLQAIEPRSITDEIHLTADESRNLPSLVLPKKLNRQQLQSAIEMVASLHLTTDQQQAAETALSGLATLVRADRWTIYLSNQNGAESEESIFEALAEHDLIHQEQSAAEGERQDAQTADTQFAPVTETRTTHLAFQRTETIRRKEGERRIIAVPLISGERVVGVIEAIREGAKARLFNASDEAILSALAVPIAAALSNSARITEAERRSLTDDLTRLHNARSLRQSIVSEVKRARRYESTVSAMFLDLDDFKRVNDRHGHLVGSHVLMELAAVVLSCVRDTDIVARYGGDEFVVILPETGPEQAGRVAERVRERIAEYGFTGGRNLRLALTASFGVATFPDHAGTAQGLLASADAAMYEAKAARKNCVRFASKKSDSSR